MHLAMTRFHADPAKTYAIFSEDDVLLEPSTPVATLSQPTLFVSELIEIPIGDRERPGHVEILQFPATATVSTVHGRLPPSLRQPKLSSKSGIVLDLNDNATLVQLDRTDFPLFPLSSPSARRIIVRGEDRTENVFVFDPLVTIADLKTFIARRLRLPPVFQLLNVANSEDPDGLQLRYAGSEFMWIDGTAALAGSEAIQVIVPAPEDRPATGPRAIYRLKWDESVTEIELGDDQTVGEAKQIYAAKVHVKAQHVSLSWRGKVMRNRQVLSERRIPPGEAIVVHINTVHGSIFLPNAPSIGPQPDDFEDQVARLAEETGTDPLTCDHYLRLNGYDFGNAHAALRDVDVIQST
jgi:hypothetical protein